MEQVVEVLEKIYEKLDEIHDVLLDFDAAYLEVLEEEAPSEEAK